MQNEVIKTEHIVQTNQRHTNHALKKKKPRRLFGNQTINKWKALKGTLAVFGAQFYTKNQFFIFSIQWTYNRYTVLRLICYRLSVLF